MSSQSTESKQRTIAKPTETPDLRCAYHKNHLAVDKCYDCNALVCVSCKEWRTYRSSHGASGVLAVLVSCQSCMSKEPWIIQNENATRAHMVPYYDPTCVIQ